MCEISAVSCVKRVKKRFALYVSNTSGREVVREVRPFCADAVERPTAGQES